MNRLWKNIWIIGFVILSSSLGNQAFAGGIGDIFSNLGVGGTIGTKFVEPKAHGQF